MKDQTVIPQPGPRVALMIDGDNLSAEQAGRILMRALTHGRIVIKRVYGNATRLPQWDAAPGFRLVHAGSGKNATDLLLTVEAMALVHDGLADVLVLATSDGDFRHLARHMVERGTPVIGIGEAKAPDHFRKCCTTFIELPGSDAPSATPAPPPARAQAPTAAAQAPPPKKATVTELMNLLETALQQAGKAGLPIAQLNPLLHGKHGHGITASGFATWRDFLVAHPDRFTCDPRGPEARVKRTAT